MSCIDDLPLYLLGSMNIPVEMDQIQTDQSLSGKESSSASTSLSINTGQESSLQTLSRFVEELSSPRVAASVSAVCGKAF